MSGFQTVTRTQPAIGVAGDFASANPRFNVLAGAGALIAGALGVYVGRFAWATYEHVDDVGAPAVVDSFGAGPVTGFVHREQQGLITDYLQEASMKVPGGFGITLMNGGDFLAQNDGAAQALPGMKAYANFADGKVTFAATGSPTGGGTSTASTIAPEVNGFNGSIEGNLLTVAAGGITGIIVPGTIIAGAGVAAGSRITEQLLPLLDGEALQGAGRYSLTIGEQDVALEAMTGSYGLLTIGGTVAAGFGVGDPLSGAASPTAGTTITGLGTGTGAAGTYYVTPSQTVNSGAINSALNVETKWIAMSAGLPGELVKISDHPLG